MNIHGYPLLIIAIFSLSISSASATNQSINLKDARLKALISGKWVPNNTFVKKKTYCYREYTCRLSNIFRFGRNVKIESTKLQRRKSICTGPANTCQCNTAPPTMACEVKFLNKR